MKRLYWLIQSLFNPVYNDEYKRLGEGEYLAKHGVFNGVNKPDIHMIEGEAIRKLDKHLHNYENN